MSAATVSNLTVRYGAKTALENLSVDIPEGCVGLLGPNGAGKTTLIKALLGFVPPAGGRASVLGHDAARQGLRIRQLTGLMPEVDCHIPGMSAVAYAAFAGELAGMPANQAMRRAHEVLEYCGLGEARYRNVETYSTGMKQRIKLAQALVHGPQLLFLDEPTNGLDPAGREEMLVLIADLSHGKGISVIVSSHLLPDIERTCDAVVVMKSGRIVTQGDIAGLRRTLGLQVDVELREFSEAFAAAIQKCGAQVVSRQGSHCRIAFPADTRDTGKLLFAAAGESGAQVRGFLPAQRTLEDIFMEAMT